MRKMKSLSLLVLSFALMQSCNKEVEAKDPESSAPDTKQVSYAIGYNIGTAIKKQEKGLNTENFMKGFLDAYVEGNKPQLTEEQMQNVLMEYSKHKQEEMAEQRKVLVEQNAKLGKEFLDANKKNEGIKELPSGLQYKVIEEGSGPSPNEDDEVVVEFTGKTINGEVFASTKDHGGSATLQVNQVIPAWTEALQKMKKGATWELFVPASLAYGEMGAGEVIGPNQTLIFTIKILDIKKDENINDDENDDDDDDEPEEKAL